MVKGRNLSFSHPARPPGGGGSMARPQTPQTNILEFQDPRNIFLKNKIIVKKNFKIVQCAFQEPWNIFRKKKSAVWDSSNTYNRYIV